MESQTALFDKNVLVVGVGGLGGFVCQFLFRIGVKKLCIVDNDVFTSSNLDRQLFSNFDNLGKAKVDVVAKELKKINPKIELVTHTTRLDQTNVERLFDGIDVVFDCCDNIETRLLMEDCIAKNNGILVHAAINGFFGQITIVKDGNRVLSGLFKAQSLTTQKTISFVPAIVAGTQVNEAIKAILNKEDALVDGKVMLIDLESNSFDIVQY